MTAIKPLKLFRTSWGMLKPDGRMSLDEFLAAVKSEGYSGIEFPLAAALKMGKQDFKNKMSDYDLGVIFQIFTDGPMAPGHRDWGISGHPEPGYTPSQCALVFKKQVEDALFFNPVKINSHSMRDFFTFSEAHQFFNEVLPFQDAVTDIPIMHETHRKRFFHSPWVCRDFVLQNFSPGDGLKMVSDYSHFTTVTECDPSDAHLNAVIDGLKPFIHHVHGRVGYDHGPQVNDPRAPEWASYTQGFETWWDNIFAQQMQNEKIKTITLTPEHGPPNYQPTLPYTQQPIADIWQVNSFIGARALQRFETKYGGAQEKQQAKK